MGAPAIPPIGRPGQTPAGVITVRESKPSQFNVGFTFTTTGGGDITTASPFGGTILAAETGYRWVLEGGYIHAFVLVAPNGAANEAILYLQDGAGTTSAALVWPIANYTASNAGGRSAAGTVLTAPANGAPVATDVDRGGTVPFDFTRCPRRSLDVGNGLFVRGSAVIGGNGVFRISGAVWGWKEAK